MAEPHPGSSSVVQTDINCEKNDRSEAASTNAPDETSFSTSTFAALFPKDASTTSQETNIAMATTASNEGSEDASENVTEAAATESDERTASSSEAVPEEKIGAGREVRQPMGVSTQSSDAESGEVAKGDDADFDPSSELQEYDDEATLDEEEELSRGSSNANELDDLARQGDMPLEDLLAMYGYANKCASPSQPASSSQSPVGKSPNYYGNGNSNSSSESEEILSNQDLTLDKDEIARDLRLSSRAPVAVDDLPEEITSLLEPPTSSTSSANAEAKADEDAVSPTKSSQESAAQPSRELRQRPQRHSSKGGNAKNNNNNKRRHSEIAPTAVSSVHNANEAPSPKVKVARDGCVNRRPNDWTTASKTTVTATMSTTKTFTSSSVTTPSSVTTTTTPKASTIFESATSTVETTKTNVEDTPPINPQNLIDEKDDVAAVEPMKTEDVGSETKNDFEEFNSSTKRRPSDGVESASSTPSGSEANPFGDSPPPASSKGFEKHQGNRDKLDGLSISTSGSSDRHAHDETDSVPTVSHSSTRRFHADDDVSTEVKMDVPDASDTSEAVALAEAESTSNEAAPVPYPIAITPAANYGAPSSSRSGLNSQDVPTSSRRRSEDKEDRLGIERLLRSADTDSESEDEEDYEPADYWRKTISVGSMYQATIPKCEKYETLGLPYAEENDICLWDPGKIPLEQTVQYLQEIMQLSTEIQLAASHRAASSQSSVSNPAASFDENQTASAFVPPVLNFGSGDHVKDEELALYILKRDDFNRKEAIKTYAKCCKGEMKAQDLDETQESPNTFTKTPVCWSEDECRAFEEGLRIYGKNFFLIKKHRLPSRSVMDLVQFYYLWKKTERHDLFANKNRLEKKKYALHPGITDYMDKFIEDHEDQLYHQMQQQQQQQNPLLHQHMQPQPMQHPHSQNHASPMLSMHGGPCSSHMPDLVGGGGLKSPTLNSLLYGASTANEIVNSFAMTPNFVNQGAIDSSSINSVLLDSSPQPHGLSSSPPSASSTGATAASSDISMSAEAVEALRAAVPEIIENISHSLDKEAIEDLVQMASQVVDAAAAAESALPQPQHQHESRSEQEQDQSTRDLTPLVTTFSATITPQQQSQTHQRNQTLHASHRVSPPSIHHKPHSSSSSNFSSSASTISVIAEQNASQQPQTSNRSNPSELPQQQQLLSGSRNSSSSAVPHSSLASCSSDVSRGGPSLPSPPLVEKDPVVRASPLESATSSISCQIGRKRFKSQGNEGPAVSSALETKVDLKASSSSPSLKISSATNPKMLKSETGASTSKAELTNSASHENSDDHSQLSSTHTRQQQQHHRGSPDPVSSTSLTNDSSCTSINLRGINT